MPATIDEFLRGNPKLKNTLDSILEPGEQVKVIIRGAFNQFVVGTTKRIVVHKTGFMSGKTFGGKTSSWEYRNVTSVELTVGAMSGVLVIRAAGEDSVQTSYWASGKGSAKEAPNAITFNSKPSAGVWQLVAELRQLVSAGQPSPSAEPPSPSDGAKVSLTAQLRELGELKESGVLTEEEFLTAKRKLLEG
jgi:hypothetical protein